MLKHLRGLGYEIGSGIMVGIPGQSLSSIAADVRLFRELDLDMIGVGPYIPHPATPLGAAPGAYRVEGSREPGLTEGPLPSPLSGPQSAASAEPDVRLARSALRSPDST